MEEILRDIRAGKFSPVYFLHGEEPFFIDKIAEVIEHSALPEAERGFNQTLLYGKDVDQLTLLDYLRRYPMMSERQVVILREAQEMKGLGELAAYMEHPMASTVFVVCHKHKKFDLRTKMGKALQASKQVVLFESKKIYDNQVPDWVINYCKSKLLPIDAAAANLLAEYIGADLGKLANELDKLALNLKSGTPVTIQLIQEYVGISKEYNIYELQKALGMRDHAKVARIQQHFASNIRKNPLVVTIGSLYSYFSKIFMLHALRGQSDAEMVKALELRSDWFLKEYKSAAANFDAAKTAQIIGLLKIYDLRSKGVETDTTSIGEEELMKELFWKIMN